MSNDILGAIFSAGDRNTLESYIETLSKSTPLGISTIEISEANRVLGGLVTQLPTVTPIRITDTPGKHNATYLIDGIDYVPGIAIGLPAKSIARLQLLEDLVKAIFELREVSRVDLALMDSSQLDEIRELTLDQFSETLIADMQKFSPPDTLYRITRP